MTSKLLTVDEAAELLNTKVRFVRRLIEERRITFHKIGVHVRIAETDINEFVSAGRVAAQPVGRSVR